MDGILVIDKPSDWTSHDVVGKLRKLLKTKRIGHTGTLDPFATGVLVMLVGQATRLAQFLDKDEKEYEATIQFGFETTTGDLTGEKIDNATLGRSDKVSVEEIEAVLPQFCGEISQVPPMYSAKKIDGKKLYELARQGVEIERKPVNVTITKLEILSQESTVESQDSVRVRVACSAGTYIRTLAEDIGRKIGVPCHLSQLRRVRAGKFSIEQAVMLEDVENAKFISMNEALSHLSEVCLSEDETKKVRNGMKLKTELGDEFVRLTDIEKNLIAIGYASENFIQPKVVFV
jgi:tRNA pseudouridine55 synthase